MGKIIGTAKLLRHVARSGRRTTSLIENGGIPGTWEIKTDVAGLSKERRRELAEALNRLNDHQTPIGKSNDGKLHMHGITDGVSLAGAFVLALTEFASQLRDAGLEDDELRVRDLHVTIEPAEKPGPGLQRGKIAKRAGLNAIACAAAAAESFDIGVIQRQGPRPELTVFGVLSDIDDDSRRRLNEFAARYSGLPEIAEDKSELSIVLHVDNVGTTLGGLMLSARKIGDFLAQAGPGCSLELGTVTPASEKAPEPVA
jgi:hypothetical protein